jgi:RNA polymerase sigma factor (sigma-70 family)
METVSDESLWTRVRADDTAAFALLFERRARRIHAYCFRRTADHALAEDLMSVVFLEAWRRRSDVTPEQVLPWLYGVATNVLRNQHRSMRRYRAALERLPAPTPQPDFSETVEARVDAERKMRAILDIVHSLPESEQDVLALCIWQGLTSGEAALALGVPETTVRGRLRRARAHLAALTSRRDDPPTTALEANGER